MMLPWQSKGNLQKIHHLVPSSAPQRSTLHLTYLYQKDEQSFLESSESHYSLSDSP
jgi:hypothetical protein